MSSQRDATPFEVSESVAIELLHPYDHIHACLWCTTTGIAIPVCIGIMHRPTLPRTDLPTQEAQPEIAASVASVDTAPSATPSTSAVKRHAASLLAAAQTTTKKLPGQVAGAAKALPGEMTSAGKELGGQAKDIAASTSRALSALPGQTSRALSSTKAAYAQGKAATIVHIEKVVCQDVGSACR